MKRSPKLGNRVTKLMALCVGLLSIAMIASCIPPDEGEGAAPSYKLYVDMVDGGFDLSWDLTVEGVERGHEVQFMTEGGSWQSLSTTGPDTAEFRNATHGSKYWFRVRVVPTDPALQTGWTIPVPNLYIDPVLPVIRIDTDQRRPILDKENYVPGVFDLDPNGSQYDAYTGNVEIRGRGNSTWGAAKKPYRVRLETSTSLMGIPKSRHWVLLANAFDQSQLRSYTAHEVAEATDLDWTPTYRHVELILNGEYVGVYQLTEQIRIAGARVDIEEMSEDDNEGEAVTGGYMLELDDRLEENNEPGFRTGRKMPVVIKDPDPATPQQHNYIRNYVQAFEDALYAPNFDHPTEGYRQYLDVDSFVDWYLIQEITRQQDAFFSSTFITKDRNGILKFGPIWDFDMSMGTDQGNAGRDYTGWYVRQKGGWAQRFFIDQSLLDQIGQRFDELKPQFDEIPDRIRNVGNSLADAIVSDQLRWNYTLSETQTTDYVSTWLENRLEWMDQNF